MSSVQSANRNLHCVTSGAGVRILTQATVGSSRKVVRNGQDRPRMPGDRYSASLREFTKGYETVRPASGRSILRRRSGAIVPKEAKRGRHAPVQENRFRSGQQIAGLTFVSPAAAHSATHVVRPGESIQAAVDAASPGDTVRGEGRQVPRERDHPHRTGSPSGPRAASRSNPRTTAPANATCPATTSGSASRLPARARGAMCDGCVMSPSPVSAWSASQGTACSVSTPRT